MRDVLRLLGGCVIGSWLLACAEPGPGAAACFGVCGEGTRCDAGRCVVAAAEAKLESPSPDEGKRGRKGRRRSRPGDPEIDDGADAATGGYQPVADGHIPRYDAKATTVLDPDAGSERLDDGTVRAALRKLEPAFDRCIADAVAGGVAVGSGKVEFVFGLTASGKVSGVTAKAPAALRDAGVDGCLRKVIFEHRFPSYDGPPMGVDYAFEYG